MNARPYKLFGEHERAGAKAGVEQRLAAWKTAWLPAETALQLECAPACGLKDRFLGGEAARWTRLDGANDAWLALSVSQGDLARLGLALLGGAKADDGGSGLALEVAQAALKELGLALLGASVRERPEALRGADAAPAAETWATGSASFAIRARIAEASIDFVSSPEWTLRLLEQRLARRVPAQLANRRQSVADQPVNLRVLAGAVELDLRAFKALEVGDVIALDTRIDEPVAVVVAGGGAAPVCAGQLGRVEDWKAIALASARA